MSEFTGPDLVRYETSSCKRCLGCQRMEQDDFVPPKKCNQAVLVAENEQVKMDEIEDKRLVSSRRRLFCPQ